jgi:lipid-A-disaccharide synthase
LTKKIYVVAGEASGDLHGAHLIENLKKISKNPLEIYGTGGDKIRQTGAKGFYDLARFHVTGFTGILQNIPHYRKAFRFILDSIDQTKPDLVVLIDNPGFNLRLAAQIHKRGVPIVYYITPQIWAWAPQRILKMKKFIKKALVVFDFEQKAFQDHGIPVTFVGHPLKDLIQIEAPNPKHHAFQVCLLPGSRQGEVRTLFPIFLKSAEMILKKIPQASFVLIESPTLSEAFYEKFLNQTEVKIRRVKENSYDVIRQSALAIACSGTATLECALLGTPVIISNRAGFLTFLAAKALIRVPYLGLPNLILGRKAFPEHLQYDATPQKIADSSFSMLTNENLKQSMKTALQEVSKKLGPGGASLRAAQEILKLLN